MSRIKQDSKVKSLGENIKFLEERMSQMLTEKEEKIVDLQSKIIISKNQAKSVKE